METIMETIAETIAETIMETCYSIETTISPASTFFCG